MSELDVFSAGHALIQGQVSPAWEARSERVNVLFSELFKPRPEVDMIPPQPPEWGVPPRNPPRAELEKQATELFDGLATRRFELLAEALADPVLVAWPQDAVQAFPRDALLDALAGTSGKPRPAPIEQVKSYTYPELRAVLARGVAESYHALLGLRDAVFVSFYLKAKKTPAGRIFLVFTETEEGWRLKTFPLGSPDDAYMASTRALRADDPKAWGAEQLVRRFFLGQASQLSAERDLMTDPVWIEDELVSVDQVLQFVGSGPERFDATELVLCGAEHRSFSELPRLTNPKQADRLRRQAVDVWGRPLHRLAPEIIVVNRGRLEPATNNVKKDDQVACLLVRTKDDAGRSRHATGAMFGVG